MIYRKRTLRSISCAWKTANTERRQTIHITSHDDTHDATACKHTQTLQHIAKLNSRHMKLSGANKKPVEWRALPTLVTEGNFNQRIPMKWPNGWIHHSFPTALDREQNIRGATAAHCTASMPPTPHSTTKSWAASTRIAWMYPHLVAPMKTNLNKLGRIPTEPAWYLHLCSLTPPTHRHANLPLNLLDKSPRPTRCARHRLNRIA